MMVRINESWRERLEGEFEKEYFKNLTRFVREEYQQKKVYPPPKQVFHAFDLTPFEEVKVVILGQDPYHGPRQANGLCFAVGEGIALPPSLQNIYKELESDLGRPVERRGDLERWARQGVLLLNATLTVVAHQAGSHQRKGWEEFTTAAIETLSREREHLVFLLWGKYAQEKGSVVDATKHLVLSSPHPSPFSAARGFFGCKHFSKTNAYLLAHNKAPVEW